MKNNKEMPKLEPIRTYEAYGLNCNPNETWVENNEVHLCTDVGLNGKQFVEVYPTIVNLTPHPINLYWDNGSGYKEEGETIPSSGFARAKQTSKTTGSLNGYPVKKVEFGGSEGMPAPIPGVNFVVSEITARALKAEGRTEDIFIVTDLVRDENGRIIGCESFAKI
jgi:hypothetical protein